MAIHAPKQARSRATWDRVLDAGTEILEDHGHEGLTIAAVCGRAGVTPPTLYARASDKQALMLAVHEHAVAQLNATTSLPDPADPADPAGPDEAVRAVARGFLVNARLLRAIMRQASTEPAIFRLGSDSIIELGRRFRDAVGGDERRADACFRVVVGALAHRVLEGPGFDSDLQQTDEEFVATLAEMAVGYLGGG